MEDKIIKLWELLEGRRIEQGISFNYWIKKWGWRCSIAYSIPVEMVEGFGIMPETALDDLIKNVTLRLHAYRGKEIR